MTNEESTRWFSNIKEGDRVEVLVRGRWVPGVVRSTWGPCTPGGISQVEVRRMGASEPRRTIWRVLKEPLKDIRPPTVLPPLTANVYADWLEERGFTEAAEALRQAFPLCGKDTP